MAKGLPEYEAYSGQVIDQMRELFGSDFDKLSQEFIDWWVCEALKLEFSDGIFFPATYDYGANNPKRNGEFGRPHGPDLGFLTTQSDRSFINIGPSQHRSHRALPPDWVLAVHYTATHPNW